MSKPIPKSGDELITLLFEDAAYRSLRESLLEVLGVDGSDRQRLQAHKLEGRAYRVAIAGNHRRSVILKVCRESRAMRNEFVLTRWLPAVGLSHAVPELYAAERIAGDSSIWHVYEDCGDVTLADRADPLSVRSALRLIGQVHAAFVDHPLLATEILEQGKIPGNYFFDTLDAQHEILAGLERILAADAGAFRPDVEELKSQLEELLPVFTGPRPISGPDTLLHGDLYPSNVVVFDAPAGADAGEVRAIRLIDWDRTGLGPFYFDLAFLLEQLTPAARQAALSAYRESMGERLNPWPSAEQWQAQFKRVRLGRIVRAIATYVDLCDRGEAEYGLDKLSQARQWLETAVAEESQVH